MCHLASIKMIMIMHLKKSQWILGISFDGINKNQNYGSSNYLIYCKRPYTINFEHIWPETPNLQKKNNNFNGE